MKRIRVQGKQGEWCAYKERGGEKWGIICAGLGLNEAMLYNGVMRA